MNLKVLLLFKYFAALVIIFSSCEVKTNYTPPVAEKRLPLEQKLMDFKNAHPGWQTNDATRKETNDSLSKEIANFIADSGITGLPFRMKSVETFKEKDKTRYVGQFEFDGQMFPDTSILSLVEFTVLGLLDKPAIDTLKQKDARYYLKGAPIDYKSKEAFLDTRYYFPTVTMYVKEIETFQGIYAYADF